VKNESSFQFLPAPGDLSVEDLVRVLSEAGHSNTCARRAVLTALVSSVEPVSPAGLLAAGRLHHPALGLVTVYRTLDILARLGLVRRLHTSEGCHSYALSTASLQTDEHDGHAHHIICQDCHRAVEFAGCDMEAIVSAVEAQTGFAVRSHWLEMFGLCPSCQEKNS